MRGMKSEAISVVRQNHVARFLVCIGLFTVLMGCAATQRQEGTGEYFDNSVTTARVKAAIFDEPTLNPFKIKIITYKGVVQLSGFVDSPQSIEKAGEVARDVPGVTEVKNDLVVK
jgi:osmotically-inducible protein OsmY